jgi:hypothetical protein
MDAPESDGLMTLRGMSPDERAKALKNILSPLANEIFKLRPNDISGAIAIFERAHREINRLASRVNGVWRHNHYEVHGRGLCGIARPTAYLTRQRRRVTCFRCQKRLGFTVEDMKKTIWKRPAR